jgi:hypothetical protein
MGSGVWSPNTYQARVSHQKASGQQDAFVYSRNASDVHPSLNPFGLEIRESRDSDEHPDSNSIIVGLDVSGSMGAVVRAIHKDLPQLLGLLLGRKYIPHPQIMFAAFSNGTCDAVPVQVAQFESDNRMDVHLENIILGGKLAGGCDAQRESAELLIYTAARHTSIDCWEKRHRKGYLFLITDEMAYTSVKRNEVQGIFDRNLPADIPLDQMIAEASERYHIFVLIPMGAHSGKDPQMLEFWKSYLDPQHVIQLENPDDVSETIALTIGLTERTITLKDGIQHLRDSRASQSTIDSLSSKLAVIGDGGIQGTGGLSADDDKPRTRRLF